MGLLKNIFDYETKELKKIDKIVDEIEALDEKMQGIKDIENGEIIDYEDFMKHYR